MKKMTFIALAFGLSLLQFSSNASAQSVAPILYGGSGDNFFMSDPAPNGFTFGDFVATESGTSLIIDTPTDSDGANGLFGGLGRDLDGTFDFDSSQPGVFARIEYRFLENNAATNFNLVLSDTDGPGSSQDFQYGVDSSFAAVLGDGSGFSEQFIPIAPGDDQFNSLSFGFVDTGDGIQNFGLRQWQIQSGFGSNDRLNLEVRLVEIVGTPAAIPEPGSFALIAAMSCTLVARRRRK